MNFFFEKPLLGYENKGPTSLDISGLSNMEKAYRQALDVFRKYPNSQNEFATDVLAKYMLAVYRMKKYYPVPLLHEIKRFLYEKFEENRKAIPLYEPYQPQEEEKSVEGFDVIVPDGVYREDVGYEILYPTGQMLDRRLAWKKTIPHQNPLDIERRMREMKDKYKIGTIGFSKHVLLGLPEQTDSYDWDSFTVKDSEFVPLKRKKRKISKRKSSLRRSKRRSKRRSQRRSRRRSKRRSRRRSRPGSIRRRSRRKFSKSRLRRKKK